MEKLIKWKKGFFSSTYHLFSNGIEVGTLKISVWSRRSKGILDGKEFDLVTYGFFKQETTIIDSKTGQEIARIVYNNWRSRALIKLSDGLECQWEYANFWHTKWILKKSLYSINYHGGMGTTGEITSFIPDESLILAGLFIANYFQRKRSAAAAST